MTLRAALRRRLALSDRSVALYRLSLSLLLVLDVVDRWPTLRWLYSDEGSHPRWAVLPTFDEAPLVWIVCLHAWSGALAWQRALSLVQLGCALAFGAGVMPRASGLALWALHV